MVVEAERSRTNNVFLPMQQLLLVTMMRMMMQMMMR